MAGGPGGFGRFDALALLASSASVAGLEHGVREPVLGAQHVAPGDEFSGRPPSYTP
jgi:hypothetical protein